MCTSDIGTNLEDTESRDQHPIPLSSSEAELASGIGVTLLHMTWQMHTPPTPGLHLQMFRLQIHTSVGDQRLVPISDVQIYRLISLALGECGASGTPNLAWNFGLQ